MLHDSHPATSNRRDWLKAAAGLASLSLLDAAAGSASENDLRAKARRNFRLGMSSDVYGKLPVAEAAARMKADGFCNVLCNLAFADARFDPLKPDWQIAEKTTAALERNGLRISSLYGYHNIVDPNAERRRQGQARMEFYLHNWKRFGCPLVATESGTFNTQSQWLESPENATEDGYRQARTAIERYVRIAEKTGAQVAIEAYYRNVIGTVQRAERLLREVSSPALKIVMDPCNYFGPQDLTRVQPLLEEMFHKLGGQIVIAHAKDVKASPKGTDTPAAGTGVLDYPLFLRLLAQLDRPINLVIEHVALADVPRARDYVRSQMEKV
jgi:sugar phosphate isomerase/epimerase